VSFARQGREQEPDMEIGLVLQGRGALGAYEWGAVTRLVEAGMP
jgi:predicted acylesterase/phospholipase RssA